MFLPEHASIRNHLNGTNTEGEGLQVRETTVNCSFEY